MLRQGPLRQDIVWPEMCLWLELRLYAERDGGREREVGGTEGGTDRRTGRQIDRWVGN